MRRSSCEWEEVAEGEGEIHLPLPSTVCREHSRSQEPLTTSDSLSVESLLSDYFLQPGSVGIIMPRKTNQTQNILPEIDLDSLRLAAEQG